MKQLTIAEQAVMRTITAREHKKALAERREARTAWDAAHTTDQTRVGWSSAPGPDDRQPLSDHEAQRVHRLLGREPEAPDLTRPDGMDRQKWKVERKRRLAAHDAAIAAWRRARADRRGGTEETIAHLAQTRPGSLARLYQTGVLDAEQLASAVAIGTVIERIGADVSVRTASLETRIAGGGWRSEPVFLEGLTRVRHEAAYTRWREALGPSTAVVLAMVAGDAGPAAAAREHGMHHRTARRLLVAALDLWPAAVAQACREIDPATLAAAHAGLLA